METAVVELHKLKCHWIRKKKCEQNLLQETTANFQCDGSEWKIKLLKNLL